MERFSNARDKGEKTTVFVDASTLVLASAIIEFVVGLVLIFAPSFVGKLLLGTGFPDITRGVARLAGIALVALAIGCWPPQRSAVTNTGAIRGLLTYNFLAAIYFCYWWIAYRSAGPLLWPAVALHAIFTALFLRAILRENTTNV